MSVIFANWKNIQGVINSIVNANPVGQFSERIATDETADKRFSDDYITQARRMSAARILEAIGSNPKHPFWGYLATKVPVTNGMAIPPSFGEIGIPEIKCTSTSQYIQGDPATSEEIDSYRGDSVGNNALRLFTNPLGEAVYDHDQNTTSGVRNPISGKYSTTNGYITFTGYACRVPMIQVPDDGGRDLSGTLTVTAASPNVVSSVAFNPATDAGKRIIITS